MTIEHGVVGCKQLVPLLDGSTTTYINLDNAASTPAHLYVHDKVTSFMQWYSSVERGSGFKSRLSTELLEEAREIVARFVGADQPERTTVFVKHTTEGLNLLAHRIPLEAGDVVLTTVMEHHANILPWQARAERSGITLDYVGIRPDGSLDDSDLEEKLARYGTKLRLLAVSGASNVTGYLQDIHRYARMVHDLGAEIVIDAAQLVPHRPVDMRDPDDPERLDYLVFSAHKMYAPYGAGAVVGPTSVFEHGLPHLRGGGAVEYVTLENTMWKEPPERDEAGSPNVVGGIALAAACVALDDLGWDYLVRHEAELTSHLLDQLADMPSVTVLGSDVPSRTDDRLGAVTFTVDGFDHQLVAAILSHEFGIGVRNGCFCAHPYIQELLGVTEAEAATIRKEVQAGDRRRLPGATRASFGFYNTIPEVDDFVQSLHRVVDGHFRGTYLQDMSSGEYHPRDWQPEYHGYFTFK